MTPLHVATVNASVRLRVPSRALAQQLPAPPESLGETLAQHVHKSVTQSGLGYYPPLEFIRSQNLVAPYLLDAVEQIAEVSRHYLQQQLDDRLVPIFSSVSVRSLQFVAFALPPIRMNQPDAVALLARHYLPSTMKCDLALSLIRKQASETGLHRYAANTIERWLADVFEDLTVSVTGN